MGIFDQRVTNRTQPASQNRLTTGQRSISNISSGNAPHVSSHSQGMNFSKGQFIRGEIIDLRGRDIKLQLNGGQLLSGKINESVELSIGEFATFQVNEATPSSVELRLVSDQRTMSGEITIDKALEAAGLPKSERNLAAVRELLGQGLSIDKNNIQNFLKQSALFRGISFHTLALMNKLSIPVTEVNVGQMESYLNYDHRIMSLAAQTADELANAILSFAKDGDSKASALNQQVLSLLANTQAASPSALLSLLSADAPLSSFGLMNSDGLLEFMDVLESFGLSEAETASLVNGSISLRDAAKLILRAADQCSTAGTAGEDGVTFNSIKMSGEAPLAEGMTPGNALPGQALMEGMTPGNTLPGQPLMEGMTPGNTLPGQALTDSGRNFYSLSPSDAANQDLKAPLGLMPPGQMALPNAIAHLPVLLQTPEVFAILNEFASLTRNSLELSGFLSKSQRMELSSQLKGKLPLTVLQKLEDGDLTAAELLKLLLSQSGGYESKESPYLSSETYAQILRQMLLDRFSMRPQDLMQKDAVEKYYDTLDKDLAILEKMQDRTLHAPAFQDTAANIRDNIDFMKTLGRFFPYLQLPMKLSGQNAHAELYVYTKKEQLLRDPLAIRVLLHLDMEQLGPVDIHLSLEQKNLQARFYLSDANKAALVLENFSILHQALTAKGYTLDARAEERKNDANAMRGFLEPEKEGTSMKRYTFDIRA